jgi:starch synthase
MRVLAVAAEAFPLLKTGGLADVVGALPAALAAEGIAVTTLLPGHPAILGRLEAAEPVASFDSLFGGAGRLLRGRAAGLDLLVLEAAHLYDRPGNPYTRPDGSDWPDNAIRYGALARIGASLARGFGGLAGYDLVHAHDWHAGLLPAYLEYDGLAHPPTVFTIHNLAFTGSFDLSLLGALGLPPAAGDIHGVEFYGGLGFLKAGLRFAEAITTVSPTYAAEIRQPDSGMGFDGLLRDRGAALHGILNGIDTAVWDPAQDPLIPARYDAADPAARAANKAALQQRLGLRPDPSALLFGAVSRLTWQKGFDLLLAALPALLDSGAQLALLGSGERGLEEAFGTAAAAHPGRIGLQIGYDEGLAHLIQAGCDALLVPSRFEPCGLTQLCALRYGALPLVARTGGLADTVIDANEAAIAMGTGTGLQFSPVTAEALGMAIRRCAGLWADPPLWARLQANAMACPVSWARPAGHYAALFRALLPR